MIITYPECAFVAFGVKPAEYVRHIVVCGLSRSTVFFPYYLINYTIFEKKKYLTFRNLESYT
jgi:hypothetical protein